MTVADGYSNKEVKLRSKEKSEEDHERPWIILRLNFNWETTEPIIG